MARAVIREKESFRAIQLTLLAFFSSQIMDYLNYVDSQHIKFSNKTCHGYNCSKYLFPFTTINKFKLYPLLSDISSCNSDSNESCLALKSSNNLSHLSSEFNFFSSDFNKTP